MAGYELTEAADRSLEDIYRYSVVTFGPKVAERYLNGMHQAFELLAENPHIGAGQSWIRPGYRRLVHESHVIYYRPIGAGVLIVECCTRHRARRGISETRFEIETGIEGHSQDGGFHDLLRSETTVRSSLGVSALPTLFPKLAPRRQLRSRTLKTRQ